MNLKSAMQVDFLEDPGDALALLKKFPEASEAKISECRLRFAFDGGEEKKAEILKALIDGGVRVTRFEEKRRDLEDIYREYGATQVQ